MREKSVEGFLKFVLAMVLGMIYLGIAVVVSVVDMIRIEVVNNILFMIAKLDIQVFKMVDDTDLKWMIYSRKLYDKYRSHPWRNLK